VNKAIRCWLTAALACTAAHALAQADKYPSTGLGFRAYLEFIGVVQKGYVMRQP
jgi:hypothetical protein